MLPGMSALMRVVTLLCSKDRSKARVRHGSVMGLGRDESLRAYRCRWSCASEEAVELKVCGTELNG